VIVVSIGSAAIAQFDWLFYVFGAFLLYTAAQLLISGDKDDEEFKENAMLRIAKKILPATDKYDGAKITTKVDGKRLVTPMLIVMVAIGTTNLLFAVDSIPAIFGLTKEPFLVFTANAFALMGLRQLFFLLGGLLRRLVYLSIGLAVILGFIGVKMILEALHTNALPFLNGGQPIPVPTVNIAVSLTVIVGVLVITAVASLLKTRRDDRRAMVSAGSESGGSGT